MTPELIESMRRISALLQVGRFRDAHDQLGAIVAANPAFIEALRLLAGTKQALGDARAAEALLRQALDLDPGWTPTLATLGELLFINGRSAEAESLLQRAATGKPPHPRSAFLLARYYNDTGRASQAVAVAAPLCMSEHADADLAGQYVAGLAALGRQNEAVAAFRRIVAAAPTNLAAAHGLAAALNAANQHAEAESIAHGAIARGHKTAALYNTLASSLMARGNLDAAEAAWRDCIKLEPRLLDAHNNLARLIWMRTGDIAKTTAPLDQALRMFANDDALSAAKAAILQGAGDPRGAYQCLAGSAASPQAPPMLLVRAGLAALEFDAAAAVSLAERALRAVPTNATARSLLTAALLGVGEAQAALEHCEALLDQTPDDQYLIALKTTAWRLLGDAHYVELCDYESLVLPLELETPAGWPDLTSFFADLTGSLNRLHDPHGHPLLFQSLRHGTETTQDLTRHTDAAIQALFASFAAPIRRYLEHVGEGADPLRRRNHGRWRFNGSWSVRLRSSGHHTNHVHPRGWLSSACYIELPDSMRDGGPEGILTFGEPGVATTPALASEYSVRPSVGLLVLFPSYFWHGTVPFRSDQPRLTVAFDVVPAG